MYDTLLVPLDGSEVSETVLPYAIELALRCHSKVVLVEIVESLGQAMTVTAAAEPAMVTPETTEAIIEGVEAEVKSAHDYLNKIATQFQGVATAVETVVVQGSPGIEIVNVATNKGADVVAVCSHGRGALGRVLMGSVADHLLHHLDIPVLVLRHHHSS